MLLYEKHFEASFAWTNGLFASIRESAETHLLPGEVPVRFAVTATPGVISCEMDVLTECDQPDVGRIFEFYKRKITREEQFTAILVIPTGIGAELGGHDGDGGPAACLLASCCDILITHPNVVNGSDINELPENGLYVEGSVVSRLLMGQIGLRTVRSNRVLVVLGCSKDPFFVDAAINAVNAARATYGLSVPEIILLDREFQMVSAYAPSGRAVGRINGIEDLLDVLRTNRSKYDAVAIASAVKVNDQLRADYYSSDKKIINPWGGVEAMLTHSISLLHDIPTAHAPMCDFREHAIADSGVVDPRIAAEVISFTFLQSVLKGLQRSPGIIANPDAMYFPGVITAADCSCLVIPDGCIGLPTLAALLQGIPVIAVRENRNLMRNDLAALPWSAGQLTMVENYWEAAGVLNCLRAGLAPESVRRPLLKAAVKASRARALAF